MTGRPCKLTDEIQEKICNAVRAGNYIETSAIHAGISKDTLYKWLKRGANAKTGKHKRFSDAIQKALADAELRDVTLIGQAASGYTVKKEKEVHKLETYTDENGETRQRMVLVDRSEETSLHREWQASAWRLERKFPDRWGRRVEHRGEVKFTLKRLIEEAENDEDGETQGTEEGTGRDLDVET